MSTAHHTSSGIKGLQKVPKGKIGKVSYKLQLTNMYLTIAGQMTFTVVSCDHTFGFGVYGIHSDSGKYNRYIIVDCPNPGICKIRRIKIFLPTCKNLYTTQVSLLWSQTH